MLLAMNNARPRYVGEAPLGAAVTRVALAQDGAKAEIAVLVMEAMKKVAVSRTQGWYWVELLHYDTSAATAGGEAERLAPDADQPYIYRVTAVGRGRKPATQAVIQSTLVRKKTRS